ncbi:MAG: hypothetical protein AB1403_02030 [Candidatus Riflebacteria bacterium]
MKSPQNFFLIILIALFFSSSAFAQPSLNPTDQLILTVKNEADSDEAFTVIRDALNGEVFYIVPGRPRLEIRGSGENARPVFHLVKYQYNDKARDIPSGAVLNFSVTFGTPEKVRENLATKIKQIFKLNDIRFAPFPIKKSQIKFYALSGKAIKTEDETSSSEAAEGAESSPDIGPGFGTQSFPYQIKLDDLDADLYEALVQGNAGLPVLMSITYQGLTPKLGCIITANFEKIFDSLDFGLSSGGTFACPFMEVDSQGNYGLDLKKLEKSQAVKIESTTGEGFTDDEFANIQTLIMPKIYAEIFDQDENGNPFPSEIPAETASNLANSQNPDSQNPLAGIGNLVGEVASGASTLSKLAASLLQGSGRMKINLTLKAKKHIKKGSFTFNLNKRSLVERSCSFGTCLNIAPYLKYKDEMITEIIAGGWAKAFFTLPAVTDPESLGIKEITMTVTPLLAGKRIEKLDAQMAKFKIADSSWIDRDGNPLNRIVFPMSAMFKKHGNSSDFKFLVDGTITVGNIKKQTIKFTREMPIVTGDFPIADPQSYVKVVTIDGFMLDFAENGSTGPVRINGTLSVNKPNYSQIFNMTAENPRVDIILPADSDTVKLNLTIKRGDMKNPIKKEITLKTSNGELQEYFELDNEVWLTEKEKLSEVIDDPDNLIHNEL